MSSFHRLIDGNASRWFCFICILIWMARRDAARPHHTCADEGIYCCCGVSRDYGRKLALSVPFWNIITAVPALL